MPKPRTKRSAVREERQKRKRDEFENSHFFIDKKRPRHDAANGDDDAEAEAVAPTEGGHAGEKEFFGMLDDNEQEYFRRADEMLELNQFPDAADRGLFIDSVFREAVGKELKVASSQSCSRLMEKLIQLASTKQRKRLFGAFSGHFLTLVQHRFASHCCEALFLRSAGVVTTELAGFKPEVDEEMVAEGEDAAKSPMEDLFLATLDELEGHLGHIVADRFASHTLRVLLKVLAGQPLEDASAKSLIKSKRKENISVVGGAKTDIEDQALRAVPASFNHAVEKLVRDCTSEMDSTSLRVLARHPIGNPSLQLLLELDLQLHKAEKQTASGEPTLLYRLLPDAPGSLFEENSEATEFINGMIYDPIGSRLVETLIRFSPGKIFKALNHGILLPRIHGYIRNDISSYAAMRVLHRLGKDDLVRAIDQTLSTVPLLVSKSRFNVVATLFDRCAARGLNDEIKKLNKSLKEACGPTPADLILTLCDFKDEDAKSKDVGQASRNRYAIQSHGAALLTALLSFPGPSKAVFAALLSLPAEALLRIATTSLPTVTILTTALHTSSSNPAFHKTLANTLILPHAEELATSQYGHNLLVSLAEVPSKGVKERSVPFHMKEGVMTRLGAKESDLRESWMGRAVWRAWRGDVWKTRRGDWRSWMREIDEKAAEEERRKAKAADDERRKGKSLKEEDK